MNLLYLLQNTEFIKLKIKWISQNYNPACLRIRGFILLITSTMPVV